MAISMGHTTTHQEVTVADRLERGEVVVFERCPFPLPSGSDLAFLLQWELDGHSKSVTLFPDTGVMGGQRESTTEERERLASILHRFSADATEWIAEAFPSYHAAMRFGPLRFRISEERGRVFEPRLSGTVLHVDANSDMPAEGDSFLRVFVNINPDQPREWRTSLPLGELLDVWGDSVRQPDETFDELMMRLHFFGKTNDFLQNQAPSQWWRFPPGSAWVVFSDLVSHAVVSGAFAIDQTYLVPASAFNDPRRSTQAVVERFWSGVPAGLPA